MPIQRDIEWFIGDSPSGLPFPGSAEWPSRSSIPSIPPLGGIWGTRPQVSLGGPTVQLPHGGLAAVAEAVSRASVPSVRLDESTGGEPAVLESPPGVPPQVEARPVTGIVRHDIRNPGKYVIYTDDNQILQNSSAEFVRALGLQVPDPLESIVTEDDDDMGFDLGDFGMEVLKTALPIWAERAIGITPEAGAPLMAPTGVLAPQTGGGMIVPPTGGPPGIPPNYGARRREPTWHYDGWSFKDGQWVRRRRRRRRKLLTEGDFNSLLKIQTLKNTDNIKIALSKALR